MKTRASWPMKDWEVRAILDGRKTQHRMPVRPQPTLFTPSPSTGCGPFYQQKGREFFMDSPYAAMNCPYGQSGDRLWVRETWMDLQGTGIERRTGDKGRYAYAADTPPGSYGDEARKAYGLKWRPSIHMPRFASRITLEIVSVRVEPLQDISEADALAEGVDPGAVEEFARVAGVTQPAGFAYRDLVESERPGAWDANDWVWVREFKRVAQEGGAND